MIKAIETVFDGYRFRSRLEARWAVFFKNAGIPYNYELEGFDLGGGVKYLPDFYLPNFDLHVEVKPNRDLSLAEIKKLALFASDGCKDTLLIIDTPGSHQMLLLDRVSLPSWEELSLERDEEIIREVFFECLDDWSEVEFARVPRCHVSLVYAKKPPTDNLDEAITAARQSRFEHGRKG